MKEDDLSILLQQAIAHHQSSQTQEAKILYEKLLSIKPNHPDALHLLGLIEYSQGQVTKGEDLIRQALKIRPDSSMYQNNLANILQQNKRWSEAIEVYQHALSYTKSADIFYNLGLCLLNTGQREKAINAFIESTKLEPQYITPHLLLGRIYFEHQNFASASTYYDVILSIEPDHLEALQSAGECYLNLSQFEKALHVYQQLDLLIEPQAPLYHQIAVLFQKLHQISQAQNYYQKALDLEPLQAETHLNLGSLYKEQKQWDLAIKHLQQATTLQPQLFDAWLNLGDCLNSNQQSSQAITTYEKALLHHPQGYKAYHAMGNIYHYQDQTSQAIDCFLKALKIAPQDLKIHNNLAAAYQSRGQIDKAIPHYQQARHFHPQYFSNLIYCLRAAPGQKRQDTFNKTREWAHSHANTFYPQALKWSDNSRSSEKRLKVGYISPDFNFHSAASVFHLLFQNHRRDQVELLAFSDVSTADAVTHKFQNLVDQWHSIAQLNDEEVFQLIKKCHVDILVDLTGHTSNNRLTLFARKPAPLQFTGLGYGHTSGLETMDYYFTDKYLTPLQHVQLNTERIIYLSSLLHWAPPEQVIELSPPPNINNQRITFGCGNTLFKVNSEVIKIWANILSNLPESQLILKAAAFEDKGNRQFFQDAFYAHGISQNQLIIQGRTSYFEHLEFYNQIDIALDPFPYQGGISSCEALYMGTPLITLAAGALTGVSLNTLVQIPQLIANNTEEYIHKACQLAQKTDQIKQFNEQLRGNFLSSAVCDGRLFAREVENAYRIAWRKWCQHSV